VNAEEYATLMNEGLVNEGQAPKYTEHDMQLYRDQSSPFTHPEKETLALPELPRFVVTRITPFAPRTP
jgi:hypothetical protein